MQDSARQTVSQLQEILADRSIVLISNRGPVEFRINQDGSRESKKGGGGLATAMTAISEATRATWISAAITNAEKEIARHGTMIDFPALNPNYQLCFANIDESVYDPYYNVISNPLLWFVYHYLWDLKDSPQISESIHRAWSDGYVRANEIFAKTAANVCSSLPHPIIMLQDYHLFVAARFLKELLPEAFRFHFTHIPWPEPDYMIVLPGNIRREILRGMLCNDLVGFQSRHYASNFLHCCQYLLGADIDWTECTVTFLNKKTYVRTYPISIDHINLISMSTSAEVIEYEKEIKQKCAGQKLIVRTDRSDPSKNILRGFSAFDALLTKHPELKGKIRFLAFLYPTRENVKEYKHYQEQIEATVLSVNAKHKSGDWEPIHLRLKDNYAESVAALKCYDVLLVNPVFDGMNLVAKEGPTINERDGVLVLSENAGAISELSNTALTVNPFDIEETASALYKALTMPDNEKKVRSTNLREIVAQNNSVKWLYYQLRDIQELELTGSLASD